MNRFRTSFAAAAGLLTLALAFTLTDGGRALAQNMKPLLVTVVNDDATPVPVADFRRPADLQPQLKARAMVTADIAASGIVALDVQSQSGVYAGSGNPVCVGAVMVANNLQVRAEVEAAQIEGYLIPE